MKRKARGGRALALCLALVAECAAEGWDRYQVFLWMHGDRARTPELFATLRRSGITGVNVEDPDDEPGPVRDAGLAFYVGRAAGPGLLRLPDDAWRAALARFLEDRPADPPPRAPCLRDRATLDRIRASAARSARRHAPAGALAFALDDELSVTAHANPFDFCGCGPCVEAFRAGLRKSHGTVEALNEAWGTRYRSFEEARLWTTDETRARAFQGPVTSWNLAPWMEARAFADASLAGALRAGLRALREAGVAAPAGFLGGQAPAAFGGHDWVRLLEEVDFVEAYDVAGAPRIVRSLAPAATRVRTVYPTSDQHLAAVHSLWRSFALGERGAVVWSDRDALSRREPSAPTPYLDALRPALQALAEPGLQEALGAPAVHDGVGLYLSQASVRVAWMRESHVDGATWPQRFGSYDAEHSASAFDRVSWQFLLEDLGLEYAWVPAPLAAVPGLRLLILSHVHALSDAEARGLSRFVEQGGTLVADLLPGTFDERGRARPSPLADLFSAEAATVRSDDGPVYTTRAHGRGRAARLALDLGSYRNDRAPATRQALAPLFRDAGLRSFATVEPLDGRPLPPLSTPRARRGTRDYLFLVANLSEGARDEEGLRPLLRERRVRLRVPEGNWRNLRTGKRFDATGTIDDVWQPLTAGSYVRER